MSTDNLNKADVSTSQEVSTGFITQPCHGMNDQANTELPDRLTQVWDVVQANLTECRKCSKSNDLRSLRKAERMLSQSYDCYRSVSAEYLAFLARINTPESNKELEFQVTLNEQNCDKVTKVMSDLDQRVEDILETMSIRSHSTTVSRTSRSSRGSVLARKQAKAEAAKAITMYTLKEADLRKRQAQVDEQQQIASAHATREMANLEADLEVLQHQKNVAAAEAELRAIQLSDEIIEPNVQPKKLSLPTEDSVLRTQQYVDSHSDENSHHGSFADSKINDVKTLVSDSNPVVSSQQISQAHKLCNESDKSPGADNNRETIITNPPNFACSNLDPTTPMYIPRPCLPVHHTPSVEGNQNSVTHDFTRFLLKRDLVLTRLFHFNEKPESYAMWKMSFQSIMDELQVNAAEELDLLVKWLGPDSTKHALSLRAANARNPQMGLKRVWERLDERYGCPEMVEAALRSKLSSFPKLTYKDAPKLYELCDILSEIESIKEDPTYMASLSYFDTSSGIIPIVSKLPYGMQEKWTSQAAMFKKHNGVTFPPFSYFVEFMKELARTKNDPSFSYEASCPMVKNKQPVKLIGNTVVSRKTDIVKQTNLTKDTNPDVYCPIHNSKHSLNKCRAFRQKPLEERNKVVKDLGICFRCCATTEHKFRDCKVPVECSECGSTKHPSALHRNTDMYKSAATSSFTDNGGEKTCTPDTTTGARWSPNVTSKCTEICSGSFMGKSCGKTLQVKVYPEGYPQKRQVIYAIIDDQSNATLARSDFFDLFTPSTNTVPYTLSSCSGLVKTTGRKSNNFVIEALDGRTILQIPTIIECNWIPNMREEIPTPEVALHHSHLLDIVDHIPPVNDNAQILLLIGRDVVEAHHVLDHRIGPRGSPYAQQLPLGWVIIGEACLGKVHRPDVINVNKTNILDNGRTSIFPPCPNNLDVKQTLMDHNPFRDTLTVPLDDTNAGIGSSVFEVTKDDFKLGMSMEDKLFIEIMDKGFYREEHGNWTAPLPFKDPRPRLPNNRPQALKRAMSLHHSLQKDPVKREHFVSFMGGILDQDHAELAPPLEDGDECWYLPLFGVYHPKKPQQIRGVFDSSAQFEGLSLNKVLLCGPDLTNSLLGILLRFRREPVAMTGDIQQMFHCFLVRPDHRNFLRFFWYEENNPDKNLVEYRMRVHVFGNCASPAVATYGIRRAAEEAESVFGSDVKEFVCQDFYVDDALKSLPSAEDAIDLMKRTQSALSSAGNLRLHKIASNSVQVMEAFSPEDRAKDLKDLDLGKDILPLQRSLGLCWDLKSDTFRFQVSSEDKPFTKRGILSTINSLYDPLGFVSPVLIRGRILLRELMALETTWDEPLPEDLQREWITWKASLKRLDNLQIPRSYLGVSLQHMTNIELHVFSDASVKAISAVAYLKAIDDNGNPRTGFVLGKTKVAPSHGHTVPRLELCAAVLAVEMTETICDYLDFPLSVATFHTDSRIVLGYIYNDNRRFYVYVSNRIARIRKSTQPKQWQYVSTHRNPADQATRSIPASDLETSTWLTGPTLLLDEACTDTYPLEDPDNDKELRPQVVTMDTNVQINTKLGSQRFERFSSWKKLVNAIANLKMLASTYRKQPTKEVAKVEVYAESERLIIRLVQEEAYAKEFKALENGQTLPKSSSLLPLNPVLDVHGLLCVGGRLNRSTLPTGERNPYIIPRGHHIAMLLVRHYHESVQHQGRHLTEGAVRSAGLWIIGGKRLISTILHRCFICRKLRGKLACQQMADLPPDRLTAGPPFTFVGVDTFGPWQVVTRRTRGGQARSKRWAILFTCLTTRAIHIEVIEEMSSSSFINSLRRFIAIRGNVKEFRSDRGTNFVGSLDSLGIDTVNIEDPEVNISCTTKGPCGHSIPHTPHIWVECGSG